MSDLEIEAAYQRYLARTPVAIRQSREAFVKNWLYIKSFQK